MVTTIERPPAISSTVQARSASDLTIASVLVSQRGPRLLQCGQKAPVAEHAYQVDRRRQQNPRQYLEGEVVQPTVVVRAHAGGSAFPQVAVPPRSRPRGVRWLLGGECTCFSTLAAARLLVHRGCAAVVAAVDKRLTAAPARCRVPRRHADERCCIWSIGPRSSTPSLSVCVSTLLSPTSMNTSTSSRNDSILQRPAADVHLDALFAIETARLVQLPQCRVTPHWRRTPSVCSAAHRRGHAGGCDRGGHALFRDLDDNIRRMSDLIGISSPRGGLALLLSFLPVPPPAPPLHSIPRIWSPARPACTCRWLPIGCP